MSYSFGLKESLSEALTSTLKYIAAIIVNKKTFYKK